MTHYQKKQRLQELKQLLTQSTDNKTLFNPQQPDNKCNTVPANGPKMNIDQFIEEGNLGDTICDFISGLTLSDIQEHLADDNQTMITSNCKRTPPPQYHLENSCSDVKDRLT